MLSHVHKRQNPGFVSGAFMPIVLYRFRISHLSNENNVAFHGGLLYSVPPFISFIAKHTGAGFPFTGNSGLKYRHVPHIFSGRRLSGAHSVGIFGIISGQLFFAFMLLRFDSYPLTRILSGRRLCVAILLIFHPK
nr:MAG: hypothetical protein [Bacteriophage sp.]